MGKKGVTITRVTAIPHRHPEEFTMNKQTEAKKQPANVWLKLTVLLVIVFSTAALLATYVHISNLRAENQRLEQQAQDLEDGNQEKQDYIDHQGTDEGVNEVATGELGMVDPDTVIYDFD